MVYMLKVFADAKQCHYYLVVLIRETLVQRACVLGCEKLNPDKSRFITKTYMCLVEIRFYKHRWGGV